MCGTESFLQFLPNDLKKNQISNAYVTNSQTKNLTPAIRWQKLLIANLKVSVVGWQLTQTSLGVNEERSNHTFIREAYLVALNLIK